MNKGAILIILGVDRRAHVECLAPIAVWQFNATINILPQNHGLSDTKKRMLPSALKAGIGFRGMVNLHSIQTPAMHSVFSVKVV